MRALKTGRKTNASKYDNDNDGRVDEDGPEDLNKDGVISMMRVKDPLGPYMINPDDPRLMRRADAQKGERGGYAIYWEGTDDDGDGFYNEDPAGGIDINRNFQHQYPYFQPDAGPHMASEAETRGVLDYVLGRRNIAAVLTFGESDNLIAPPTRTGAHAPASVIDLVAFANQSVAGARDVGRFQAPLAFGGRGGRGFGGGGDDDGGRGGAGGGGRGGPGGGRAGPTPPATTVNAADVEYFRAVSDKYRQLTGLRSAPATRIPGGAFFEYAYYQFGVPAFSTPGWGIAEPAGAGRGGPGAGGGEGRAGGPGGGRGAGPAGDAAGGAARGHRHRGVRSAPRALDGCGEDRRLHRVAALQAPDARRRRNRRLQALRDDQPAAGAHCRARQVARRVCDLPRVDLPAGVDRRHVGDRLRRRALSRQGRNRKQRIPADVDGAGRALARR